MTAIRTHAELRQKAAVTLGHRFLCPRFPTKTPDRCADKPTPLGTVTKSALAHLTDNSHGIPVHRRRASALRRNRRAWHTRNDPPKPSCVAAFSGHGADLPPSRATSLLRLCNQSCTDSAPHAHFSRTLPSRLSSGHLAPVPPMLSECAQCFVDVRYMPSARW